MFTSGDRFGPYEIVSPLGAGGMGEVYRARDAQLQRDVALKVLPAAVAADADRLARFQREAQLLAALSHPNIGAIFGIEESGSTKALVLELVEGRTLEEVNAAGAMSLDEALGTARQVAEALEAAHETGIVHRDLKPANIKIRPDGTVKVLDFGLAKALTGGAGASGADVDPMNSPTLTVRGTAAGLVLGTAAYMAPEQARGRPVDKRADIWAFGVVLFEMLSGHRLFAGDTVGDTLAAVLRAEIDWARLPPTTPSQVRGLLERCLERDPKARLRDIGEARIALGGGRAPSSPTVSPPSGTIAVTARYHRWGWPVAALLAVALVLAVSQLWRAPVTEPVIRFDVAPPPGGTLNIVSRRALSLSSDGTTLVFVATERGNTRLYVRRRDETAPHVLEGTDGATDPCISPAGHWVSFVADNQLKKVPVNGGPVITLTPVNDPKGSAWLDDDTIVLAAEAIAGLSTVSAAGGPPTPLTTLDAGQNERTHRWPHVLPGGKAVLFTVGYYNSPDNYDASPIDAVTLATGARTRVLTGARRAGHARSGHLVFAREQVLYVAAFDVGRLAVTGTPAVAVQGVAGDTTTGASHFALSSTGTLAYVPGSAQALLHQLAWVDLAGSVVPLDLPPGGYFDPVLSPDGTRVAFVMVSGSTGDVWTFDLGRKRLSRLTFDGRASTPVWSADGRDIWYVANDVTGKTFIIVRRRADGSGGVQQVATFPGGPGTVRRGFLKHVSADRSVLMLDSMTATDKTDILALPVKAGSRVTPLVASKFDEYGGTLSPDGRFLAYQSDESGRFEIYVRDVSSSGGRWQVSTSGGEEPRWQPDGRAIFYRNESRMMRTAVRTNPTFDSDEPVALFGGGGDRNTEVYNLRSDSGVSYDVDKSGTRFLMVRPAQEGDTPLVVRVVLNWFGTLGR